MTVTVHIVDGPVRPAAEASPDPGAGAVLTFLGVVRPLENDRPLEALDYEAYEPMAERELQRLARETAARFGLLGLRLVHSRGLVPAGEPSLLIEARSPHRREALDAMDHLIDRLKRDVPIWKRPVYSDAAGHPEPRGGGRA